MNSKNRIVLLNIASTAVLQGLAFFSGPIFSSMLGTSNYGIASVYHTWVQIASISFSLQAGGAIAVAMNDYSKEDQKKYQSSVFSLATLAFLFFSSLVMLFAFATRELFSFSVPMIALGLIQGWGMYLVTAMNSKLAYEFKAGKNFILSVCASAFTIGMSIFLIGRFNPEDNYWGRIIGQSSVYFIIGCILFLYMVYSGKTIYNKEYWVYTLPITIPSIFHLLAHIVLNQSDRIMIQSMVDNSTAGVYALAATFSVVISSLWSAFNNTWVPFYYEYTRNNQLDKIEKHSKNYIELFTIITVGFILLCREVFHLYAVSNDFRAGTDYIPLLAIGYYFVFLYSFPVNFEFYNKKTKIIAVGTISSAILNIVLNYILIINNGAVGAVIATVFSHVLLFIFHFAISKRMSEAVFPYRLSFFAPWIGVVIAAYLLYCFTKDLWFIRWGIVGVLSVYILTKMIKRKEIF